MAYIKFIDREEELKSLGDIGRRSFFLVVSGRRRIGKTRLLRKAFPKAAYIFIWPDKSMGWIIDQVCKENGLPSYREFKDLLGHFLGQGKAIIIDEFQNLLSVDKSTYGEIQRLIDDRKINGGFLQLAAAGSSYSLMNKVFNDAASPLYGRRTDEIVLGNIPIKPLFNSLGRPLEDFIKLWSVFEGVPYYYELLDSSADAENNIERLIISGSAQLQGEGKALLSSEFGRDSKTYSTVLTGISEGKTKLGELAGLFGGKKNEVVKYLDILRNDFRLVKKMTPVADDPRKSREGRYEISDNFLSFWFYFVERLRSYSEQGRPEELKAFFSKEFNSFLGRKFEKFMAELIKEGILLKGLNPTSVGGQWGATAGAGGQYEVDIVALNSLKNEAVICECKWKENVNCKKAAAELERKSGYIRWKSATKVSYALFAKSFDKKIVEFGGKKIVCMDFKDIRAALKG